MPQTNTTICCIGHITHDINLNAGKVVNMPGGTALYFSHALAHMPVNYKLVTAVASRERIYAEQLHGLGVDVLILPSAGTVFFENTYGTNPDERMQRVLQTADSFTTAQLRGIDADLYHLGPLLADDFDEDVIPFLASKGRVSLDVQGLLRKVVDTRVVPVDWPEKYALLPYIHTLKVNEMELSVLTGMNDIRQAAKKLGDLGVKEVVITLGSNGSLIYADEKYCAIVAFKPAVFMDATGCGDTYMAGYLYQRASGATVREAGRFASAMAGLKAGCIGPFSGTEDEVKDQYTL
ncbi:ribokinase [Mucilaginibacter hurinus]|uniref:Ribokinase n=1 Tax=Mucilaginibacter hurinus TaxID=2201324 RepID=A0A367GN26_9SPHI|nr:PfkB family carbohydrate kinase [Mucilaginibacter hurinus]RCH54266.1 ribokinase [Mucilaginibacter hurinus]